MRWWVLFKGDDGKEHSIQPRAHCEEEVREMYKGKEIISIQQGTPFTTIEALDDITHALIEVLKYLKEK